MHGYRFSLNDGRGRDELGTVALCDDGAALTFGKRVIQDLKKEDQCATGVMLIAAGDRAVCAISFSPASTWIRLEIAANEQKQR